MSTFSFVEQIWNEKMKPHISYYAVPIMMMGIEDADVITKASGTEKGIRKMWKKSFSKMI